MSLLSLLSVTGPFFVLSQKLHSTITSSKIDQTLPKVDRIFKTECHFNHNLALIMIWPFDHFLALD